MQDIHTLTGGVGGGNSSSRLLGDRRFRQHGGHPNNQQSLKCPRCDSLNTKFCYYNNYNLSQPRHFCKNCRRYWTKGGVLRNVPVGGGCRKSKRSSKPKVKQQTTSSSEDKAVLQSHSSSESSNNTNIVTNTINTTTSATRVIGTSSGSCGIFQISDANILSIRNLDPLIDAPSQVGGDVGSNRILYPGELGGFVSLINNNNSNNASSSGCFNGVDDANGTTSFGHFMSSQATAEWEFGKIGGTQEVEDVDPTVRMDDLLQNRGIPGGLAALDWHDPTVENVHQGLFDLSSTVDDQPYWSHEATVTTDQHHHSHWSDNANDNTLFLP